MPSRLTLVSQVPFRKHKAWEQSLKLQYLMVKKIISKGSVVQCFDENLLVAVC
jgi:hypothetical protein